MDWVDTQNYGVSHFGFDANLFPINGIRFDTFHLRLAITRHFLSSLHSFVTSQIFQCQKDFVINIIENIWSSYYIFVWKANKQLSTLKGKQILSFIKKIPDVISFLQCKFVETEFLNHLCGGLSLWVSICEFIHITKVDDTEKYEDGIITFKSQLKTFYEHGRESFLSNKSVGDRETMYMHVLRYYIPKIVDATWEKFKLGIGIFTMQGIEHHNKESKSVFINHTNKHGNQVEQCSIRLWNMFYYTESHNIKK